MKALPWYGDVRTKLTDPQFSGWFLKFAPGANGSYHVPQCTESVTGGSKKCSVHYHDQEQSPQPGVPKPTPAPIDGWGILDPGSIPALAGGPDNLWSSATDPPWQLLTLSFVL